MVMEDAGFQVVGITATMEGALHIAAKTPVDIAIMDISLAGDANGIEAAKRLRQDYNVPCLFVSAEITEKNRAMALEWEPIGFIGKPYKGHEIIDAIRSTQCA